MIRRRRRRWPERTILAVVAVVALVAVLLDTPLPAQDDRREPGAAEEAAGVGGTRRGGAVEVVDRRVLDDELEDLATIWAEGGGRWGHPFWYDAYRRWLDGDVEPAVLREYAAGYEALLRPGCEAVAALDPSEPPAVRVREQLEQACDERVAALELQVELLDALVEQQAVPAAQVEADELQARFEERLQASYRATRIAMLEAQQARRRVGLPRLPEDAFV